ncbi:hypothetical protein [Bradyrhizobium sp. BRP56]|uniref:hypothetical protein n=1 Tax=Bradyrhizobium sp. BRP56 TaxID=2793819 RepID=UPI001CD80861|nr:hypothetical protein [Bradyrhizobium sp. BRP56]MCA1401131.1 hypothetical protein [Bradyrhizobium sp. BRP56]
MKEMIAVAPDGGCSATTELLAMPIRQYFVWVGSALLVALFAADWWLPDSPGQLHSAPPPNDRISLRIRSDHKWPERVVFDTAYSGKPRAADSRPALNDASNPDVAQVRQRNPRNAFAAMEAVTPTATNDNASATPAKPRSLQRLMTSAIKSD